MKMLLERKSILARDLALLDFWDVTTPYCGGAHGRRRTALAPVVGHHRIARRRLLPSPCGTGGGLSQMEETVYVIPPLPQGV